MAAKNLILPNYFVSLVIFLFAGNVSFAQIRNKEIYRKYLQSDSSANMKSVLILYTDKTYFNFGTFNDPEITENYVWFDYGKWTLSNCELICNTNSRVFDQSKVINEIKFYYKGTENNRLYNDGYKYIRLPLKNYSFIMIKNKAIDLNRKIEYKDFQNNESISNNQ